jgi:hypothetical protein
MIAVELTAAINAAGTLQKFYLSDDNFASLPTDTPANTAFNPVLTDPGTIGIKVFSDGRTGGASKLEVGELVLNNVNGELDAWLGYSFDGRAITIRSGEKTAAYPGGWTTLLTGTVETLEADFRGIVVRLRDKQYLFSLPVQTNTYLGNNALPNGAEGTASDIKGKVKPRAYGVVINASPVLVNTSKLTYQLNDGAINAVTAVYDRGVALTQGADYASLALLEAASPAAGTFITSFALGLIRLGGLPTGLITSDFAEASVASGGRKVAQILAKLAKLSGIVDAEINQGELTALSASSEQVGIYIDSETTIQEAMDKIAASIGAYYFFDAVGMLRMGQLAPAVAATLTLFDYQIKDNIQRRPARDNSIPAYKVLVEYSKNHTVQTSDLAGAVTGARRASLATEYRKEVAADLTVKTKHLLARELTVTTLHTVASDALAEANRQLTIHKVARTFYDVSVPIGALFGGLPDMMTAVALSLTQSRFDLSTKVFRIVGIRIELRLRQVVFTVWG